LPRTQEIVTVRGVIRGSENPNMFVPDNVPSKGQWFYVDVPAMARTLDLPEDTVLIEVVQEPNKREGSETFPVPKDAKALLHSSVTPQDHINYALTW
jgi:surfeit locus 1 family protein